MTRDSGFSIVRFSPDQEEIERVNVALLLWGADAPIRFRDDFPKLRCVAGDVFPGWFLVEYLLHLSERARKPPDESYVELSSASAQVRVSRFRATSRVAAPAFVDALTKRYRAAREHGPRRRRERLSPSS